MMGARPFKRRAFQALFGAGVSGLILCVLGPGAVLAQCSMCKDAVAAAPSATREAMNYAIIGLAFAPYGIAALAAWTLSPAVRTFVRGRFRKLALRASGPSS
ncbi:MAG: hypothetical protein ABI565_07475 [Vicinamibacteria bacterium]